ncbi:hypothetical protein FKM82_004393 [Ascaphus truei]
MASVTSATRDINPSTARGARAAGTHRTGPGDSKPKVVKLPKTLGHPTTLSMVVEALKKRRDRKGTSVPAIRTHILAAHPTVDPVRLKALLRSALSKGIDKGVLVRPLNSTASGATGRFKLAKVTKKLKEGEASAMSENVDPNEEKPAEKKAAKKAKAPKEEGPKEEKAEKPKAASKKTKTSDAKPKPSAKPQKDADPKPAKAPAKKPKTKAEGAEEGGKGKEPAKTKAKKEAKGEASKDSNDLAEGAAAGKKGGKKGKKLGQGRGDFNSV